MAEKFKRGGKGPFEAIVVDNHKITRGIYKVLLEFSGTGAQAFSKTQAGQFAQIDVAGIGLPQAELIPTALRDVSVRNVILRRPFSFSDVRVVGDKCKVEIIYCVVGAVTVRMMSLDKGDKISVIGPLGKGFELPSTSKKIALLVIGGMGAPPLQHLAKVLAREQSEDLDVYAFAGAKSIDELPFEINSEAISEQMGPALNELADCKVHCVVATDDGSVGYKGFVTDCLESWLENCPASREDIVVYTCGPEIMMAKVAGICADESIDCQVSLERRMACGIGLCQACAVQCVNDAGEKFYKMCCKDGPVFDAGEVVF